MSELEHLALSGKLFNPIEPSFSPARTPSPSNDSEELVSFALDENIPHGHAQHSIGLGDGRTGVKGVIRDRNEAEYLERERKLKEAEDVKRKMQQHERGLKSLLEEERENADLAKRQDNLLRKDAFGRGRTGHLREIGVENFIRAIEQADKGAYVIVHLYDPSLDRCYALDEALSGLAKIYTETRFFRARASSLGFACKTKAPKKTYFSHRVTRSVPKVDDEDDPFGTPEDESPAEDSNEDEEDTDLDTDVLPTVHVYLDGELVHNWVRVDWVAGRAGFEDLLVRHKIIARDEGISFSRDEDDSS